jgi:hypothetical protein
MDKSSEMEGVFAPSGGRLSIRLFRTGSGDWTSLKSALVQLPNDVVNCVLLNREIGEPVIRQSSIAALRGATAYWPFACIALTLAIPYPLLQRELPPSPPVLAIQKPVEQPLQEPLQEAVQEPLKDPSRVQQETVEQTASIGVPEKAMPKSDAEYKPEPVPLSYLAYYAYSEVPPDIKPADTLLNAFWQTPEGAPVDEIDRASKAMGLDPVFMKAVAKIESGFDPKQRTGSYIGLFQLSHYEFDKYGSGDILDARANAVAAMYKFATAAILFEISTHKKATLYDLYLIHQQGTQGAAEHVSNPDRIAWQSMCATDEGRQKGEKWCKRAIWQNTLPEVKKIWKSVENMTSAAFTAMWQDRVDLFYSRYSQALTAAK